jgi:hypothetical protein
MKRERLQTYKETSKHFLPVKMPLFLSEVMVPSTTNLIIPVTTTIKQSQEGIHILTKPRLQAISEINIYGNGTDR